MLLMARCRVERPSGPSPEPTTAAGRGGGDTDWLSCPDLSGLAQCEPNNPWPITLKASHLPFSVFLGWGHRICSLLVFTPSVRMPHLPPFSFVVMNDRWPSHWQLSSWCHIITVSPFRQNYQITSVLKRPGRLTGRPTKETQISKKRRTLKTSWILTDRQGFPPPLALNGHQLQPRDFRKAEGPLSQI